MEESYFISVVIGILVGLTSEMGFVVREGCRELVSEVGRSQSGQGSREAPGPSVHGRMRFASSLPMSIWKARLRCRLPKELRGLPFGFVTTFGSHGMENGGVWCFLP